ncbi:hypothetical protein Psch_01506 [Pelotomaculum schinkii]|uniref:Uncharacterized protein n=1 Tax=Pelotomaculum schinkii TaxID=78350 RepID=A0A4Y7R5K8_9FIRM|nr:hypothetical protein Psch_03984 [Pelotomaculum schinkii]TEB09856.1 hypothetical protein Psfp_04238 [Pelotomaculum sp. FP]TEB04268.1 hypothetical protein Psch_03993 [Pelotomaculum schinkii]TEB05693.1 hypothetical protein Psch_02734 [Pelotomaculum schinkii]TEB05993.1 hypothetical protein Psch_03035 [Pelotomaculum schinkii]
MLWGEISVKEQGHYWEIRLSMGIVSPSPIEGAFLYKEFVFTEEEMRVSSFLFCSRDIYEMYH